MACTTLKNLIKLGWSLIVAPCIRVSPTGSGSNKYPNWCQLVDFACMCDIEQMFFQFKVNPEHRDYLRFLWWELGDCTKEPIQYRMKEHLLGATSSPGSEQIAEEYGEGAANFF